MPMLRILWFDNASKQNKAKEWNEQLQEVMSFESVEEFWGLYNKCVAQIVVLVRSVDMCLAAVSYRPPT